MTDIIIFAGQSNMAGRGAVNNIWKESIPAAESGYEYRAITAPDSLIRINNEFGRFENRTGGIDDKDKKTGSLVPAFVNAYVNETGNEVIAVSASEGGTAIREWIPGARCFEDAMYRLEKVKQYAKKNNLKAHIYMAWCQGETDGDWKTSSREYRGGFTRMLDAFEAAGVEHVFLIAIGQYNGSCDISYDLIHSEQLAIAAKDDRVLLASDMFWTMKDRGMMKDEFHYFQQAYNETGADAGKNAGKYRAGLE